MLFYINRAQQCRTTWSSLLPIEGQFTPSHYDTEAQIRDKLQRQPLNSWIDQRGAPGRKITRAVDSWDCGCITPPLSLTQAFHNNKPSTRGDETIWTWTSEENMPCFLIIPTLTDQSVFPPLYPQWNLPTWSAPIDSSAAQWCEIKRVGRPVCERSTSPLGAGERTLCKQDRQKDQSRRPYLLA